MGAPERVAGDGSSLLAMNAQHRHGEDPAGFATAGCATFAAEVEGRNGAGWGNISDAALLAGLGSQENAKPVLILPRRRSAKRQ
jgi:hypothetical protein